MKSVINIFPFVFLIGVTLSVEFKNEDHKRVRCGDSSFFNTTSQKCQSCGICGPGTYIKTFCGGTHDYHCKGCKRGHFSTRYTRLPGKCRKCSSCGDRPVLKKCTKVSDTVCGDCPLGTFMSLGECVPCQYCFPDMGFFIPRELSCEKPQIPASHRCTTLTLEPYVPPYLVPMTDDNGNKYFVSSDTLKTEEFGTPISPRVLIKEFTTIKPTLNFAQTTTSEESQDITTTTTATTTKHNLNDLSEKLPHPDLYADVEEETLIVEIDEKTTNKYLIIGFGTILGLCIVFIIVAFASIRHLNYSKNVQQKPYRPIVRNKQQYFAHFVDENAKHSLKSSLLDNA